MVTNLLPFEHRRKTQFSETCGVTVITVVVAGRMSKTDAWSLTRVTTGSGTRRTDVVHGYHFQFHCNAHRPRVRCKSHEINALKASMAKRSRQLVSSCLEPRQPQWVISGLVLKTGEMEFSDIGLNFVVRYQLHHHHHHHHHHLFLLLSGLSTHIFFRILVYNRFRVTARTAAD